MKNRLALLISFLALTGCPNRAEIRAHLWLESGIPKKICAAVPEVAKSGIYRKLNDGRYEFISYCNPEIAHYLSIQDAELNDILNRYIGPEQQGAKASLMSAEPSVLTVE